MDTNRPGIAMPAELRDTIEQLPEHMRESVSWYVLAGQPPGGFLTAVLCNDLHEAAARADALNQRCLFRYGQLLHDLPWSAWGSREAVDAWVARGGLGGVVEGRPDCTEEDRT